MEIRKIYYLPLEPLDKRYTKQWYEWFPKVWDEIGIEYEVIEGEKAEHSLQGKFFLDMKSTFVWKFEQLKELFKRELGEKDVIFIPDGEFPGLEAIEYYRKFYSTKAKIVTLWHAGTYDQWDLTYQVGLERVGSRLEEVWLDISDLVFVATIYHKNIILKNRMADPEKIKVVGWPADVEKLRKMIKPYNKRKKFIIFTGRLSIEKGIDVVEALKDEYCITVTQRKDWDKEEYYRQLTDHKIIIAPSRQETFGYGVVEGMATGTIPIVYDGLSFQEYVPKEFRVPSYNPKDWAEKIDEMLEKIDNISPQEISERVKNYDWRIVIRRMTEVIAKCL